MPEPEDAAPKGPPQMEGDVPAGEVPAPEKAGEVPAPEKADDVPAPEKADEVPASEKADEVPAGEVPAPSPATAGGPAANPKPRPDGEPAAVVALRELIESKLAEVVERYSADANGAYVFGLESALVYVVPAWLQNGATVVRIFAITNLDVQVTHELTRYLLAKNLDFVLGGFAVDSDNGAVWFHHNLLGEYLAPEELEATLGAVAATANDLDDEIKARFGGRLYIEAPDESIPPPVAPGYL